MLPVKNQKLRNAIAGRGLTQRQVSFALGVSEGFLSSVIRGYKKPPDSLVERLSFFFGQKPDDLFPGNYGSNHQNR